MPLDVINVAHVADGNGKCSRCGAGLGSFVTFHDDNATWEERPWRVGERVLEYECPDGRNRFADQVTGWTQDCVA